MLQQSCLICIKWFFFCINVVRFFFSGPLGYVFIWEGAVCGRQIGPIQKHSIYKEKHKLLIEWVMFCAAGARRVILLMLLVEYAALKFYFMKFRKLWEGARSHLYVYLLSFICLTFYTTYFITPLFPFDGYVLICDSAFEYLYYVFQHKKKKL